jgi:hypothetical protein
MQVVILHKELEIKNAEIGYFDEFWASPPMTPSSNQ